MVEQRKMARGWAGRFMGPRVNCENVPCLPAALLSRVLDDPRQVPYLMIWKEESSDKLIEAARVAAYREVDREIDWARCLEIKRVDGSKNWILTVERPLPWNGGRARLVICPRCQGHRRALYPWKVNPSKRHAVFTSSWQCRSCAGLRFASEGGALVFHPRTDLGRLIEAIEASRGLRPVPWYPYVLANPLAWTMTSHLPAVAANRPFERPLLQLASPKSLTFGSNTSCARTHHTARNMESPDDSCAN
jgi:hypothetical protein